jgi:hypothetical protein
MVILRVAGYIREETGDRRPGALASLRLGVKKSSGESEDK